MRETAALLGPMFWENLYKDVSFKEHLQLKNSSNKCASPEKVKRNELPSTVYQVKSSFRGNPAMLEMLKDDRISV